MANSSTTLHDVTRIVVNRPSHVSSTGGPLCSVAVSFIFEDGSHFDLYSLSCHHARDLEVLVGDAASEHSSFSGTALAAIITPPEASE